MSRTNLLRIGIAAIVIVTAALGAAAHDGRRSYDRALRGGTCTGSDGDRYRIVEAVSLRRSVRRDLARLPLHRQPLGHTDTLIIVERLEEPIGPLRYSLEQRIAEDEAHQAALEAEAAADEGARASDPVAPE